MYNLLGRRKHKSLSFAQAKYILLHTALSSVIPCTSSWTCKKFSQIWEIISSSTLLGFCFLLVKNILQKFKWMLIYDFNLIKTLIYINLSAKMSFTQGTEWLFRCLDFELIIKMDSSSTIQGWFCNCLTTFCMNFLFLSKLSSFSLAHKGRWIKCILRVGCLIWNPSALVFTLQDARFGTVCQIALGWISTYETHHIYSK